MKEHTNNNLSSNAVVILGGGISGLTTAFFLRQRGIDVLVLEKDLQPGGTMKTESEAGWLIETGPNSTLETTPLFRKLFDDLGLRDQVTYAAPAGKVRFIVRNGELHPLPMGAGDFLRSRLWTLRGKLRLLKEPFIGRGVGEESIAAFVERRLGREFLDYAINPFVSGVYAGDPQALSVQAAFPKLYALEEKYGGLVKGLLKGRKERKQRAEKAKDRAEMFSFRDGMQTLPFALTRALGNAVRLGSTVDRILPAGEGHGFTVEYRRDGVSASLQASMVVMSVPAFVAAPMVRPFAPDVASSLGAISYPPVAEVFTGYKKSQIARSLEGFGFLVPEKERRNILGVIWSSSLFPNRTPGDEYAALTTFVGGARQPELALQSDERIMKSLSDELRALMGVEGLPQFVRIRRWEKAIPQYNLGYGEILRQMNDFEVKYPGLYITGNYRGGIAVGDCVMNAGRTVEKIYNIITMK